MSDRRICTFLKHATSSRFLALAVIRLDSIWFFDSRRFSKYITDYPKLYRHQNYSISYDSWGINWEKMGWAKNYFTNKKFITNILTLFHTYGNLINRLNVATFYVSNTGQDFDKKMFTFFWKVISLVSNLLVQGLHFKIHLHGVHQNCFPITELHSWDWISLGYLHLSVTSVSDNIALKDTIPIILENVRNVTTFSCSGWMHTIHTKIVCPST